MVVWKVIWDCCEVIIILVRLVLGLFILKVLVRVLDFCCVLLMLVIVLCRVLVKLVGCICGVFSIVFGRVLLCGVLFSGLSVGCFIWV